MLCEIDRIIGMLVGLAIGDAVGTTNEFKNDPTPIHDMIGGGPFQLKAGEWTDDTSMALCLTDSLIEMGRFHYGDQLDRYVDWWQNGYNSVTGKCFDIGTTTRHALSDYITHGNTLASTDFRSAGNGSLMRLAPIVIAYNSNEKNAIFWAGESSKTTHGAPNAVDSCRYFAKLLLTAIKNLYPKHKLIESCVGEIELVSDVKDVIEMNYDLMEIFDVKNPSGYVIDSLRAALFCFHKTENFKDGCLLAANLGGDADTVAAIYGQLAGAYYGIGGIPKDWCDKLAWYNEIVEKANNLYQMNISNWCVSNTDMRKL